LIEHGELEDEVEPEEQVYCGLVTEPTGISLFSESIYTKTKCSP